MELYTARFILISFDHEEKDGTWGKNEITLTYQHVSKMEAESRYLMLCKGGFDTNQVVYTLELEKGEEERDAKLI